MWKKIGLGLLVLIVVVVGLVFYLTSGMTETAENFFKAVQSKQYDKAYSMFSKDFRQNTPKEKLIAFLKREGLDQYRDASWGNRSFEGKTGVLEGAITTTDGGTVPLTIKFVKGPEGKWQIYAISKPEAGIEIKKDASAEPKLPDRKESARIVKNTIHLFALSVNEKNMSKLYASTAGIFQKSVSLEKLNSAMASFIKMGVDFTVLDQMEPKFTADPSIDGKGILTLEGYYETTPNHFNFELRYIREGDEWKPITINLSVK